MFGGGAGAIIGALIGSIVPGPGTLIGAAVGATIGGIVGVGTVGTGVAAAQPDELKRIHESKDEERFIRKNVVTYANLEL